jgi:glucosamine-6-phosphate deaminase
MHPNACIICDDDATLECRVRTVRYFKGLEKVHLDMLGKDMHGAGSDNNTDRQCAN